jgi:hypothetical protein
MAEIVNIKKRAKDMQAVCEDELEEIIHVAFLKRQDLMRKVPIMDAQITQIDMWLVQQKLPLDVLISICARAQYCEWVFYGDANADLKRLILLHLRDCYKEFQKLPANWQEALWPMLWGKWHAEFMDEEEEEAANGAA